MIPKGLSRVAFAGTMGAALMAACGDRIVDSGIPKNLNGGGDSGGPTSCWPTDSKCYGGGTKDSPGGECMAIRDNTPVDSKGSQHIQLRQNWVRAMTPLGNSTDGNSGLVYTTLNSYTQLPWSACYSYGNSGYIQLFDFTLNSDGTGDSWVGFAKYVSDLQTTITNGLCMVEDTWANDAYVLAAPTPDPWATSTTWPTGLPKPMWRSAAAWKIKPTHAKRVSADFDPKANRLQILASFEPGGANYGYDGIFFYDPATGKSHGFSRLSYLIIYDTPKHYIAVPIREAETASTFNDPAHPNCVGAFRGDALKPPDCAPSAKPSDDTFPAWGCSQNNPCDRGKGPATTDGYFLITELEQIYATALQSTLCVSYPTSDVSKANGWTDPTGKILECRLSPNWNPSDPINGIPTGDWCAETNSAGSASCHDAYKSSSFHVFSAFPVQTVSQAAAADGGVDPNGALTGTCTAF